jgi:hypothetical protein
MFAFVLILAASVGQSSCSGGSCAPSSFFQPSYAPQVVYQTVRPNPQIQVVEQIEEKLPPMDIYKITHAGLTFEVEGYRRTPNGKVTWYPSDNFNVRSYHDAKLLATESAKPKEVPPAVKELPPAAKPATGALWQTNGVEKDKLGTRREAYTATTNEAKKFIADAGEGRDELPRIHITVVGSDDERAPVVNDLLTNPEFKDFKDRLHVQGYTPTDWAVDTDLGFQTKGTPSIIVQLGKSKADPHGGKEIYRANNYNMGPHKLAEELRKMNPNYKPDITPGPATGIDTPSCPVGFTRAHTPYVLGAFIVCGIIFFKLPRKAG